MSNLIIEVKNDDMLGRTNDKALHITLIEQQKEIERLKEEYVMLQNASDEVEEEKDKEIERLNKEIEYLKEGKPIFKSIALEVYEENERRINKATECIEKQKPLSVDETRQKEQLKLAYKNSDIFKTICHLEDLEIAIWEVKDILKRRDKNEKRT